MIEKKSNNKLIFLHNHFSLKQILLKLKQHFSTVFEFKKRVFFVYFHLVPFFSEDVI
jgi:hypothetical protein